MDKNQWEPGMLPTITVSVPEEWQEKLGVSQFEAHVGGSCTADGETTTTVCWQGVNYELRLGLWWKVGGESENPTKMFDNAIHPFNIRWDDEKMKQVIGNVVGQIAAIQVEYIGVAKVQYRVTASDWTSFTLDGQYIITFKDNEKALAFVDHLKRLHQQGDTIQVTVVR